MKTGNYNNFHECVSCENAKLVCMFSGRFLCFSLFMSWNRLSWNKSVLAALYSVGRTRSCDCPQCAVIRAKSTLMQLNSCSCTTAWRACVYLINFRVWTLMNGPTKCKYVLNQLNYVVYTTLMEEVRAV